MFNFRFFVFLSALCCCLVLGASQKIEGSETKPVNVPVQLLSPSTESTVDPTTPTIPPTTTPPKTTTTTTTSSTTTTTTTTTEAPTTTTVAPTTTTPTPTPKPGPAPAPELGTWMYTDDKNVTCIVVKFAAQLNVSYSQTVNKTQNITSVVLNVPVNNTWTAGNCTGDDQWISISWPSSVNGFKVNNSMLLAYARNDTTKQYALRNLNVTLDSKELVNLALPSPTVQFSHGADWQTPLATSYRCGSQQLNFSVDATVAAAELHLTQLQEEAFRTQPGQGFSADRRKILDMLFLYDVIRGRLDCPELLAGLSLYVPSYGTRKLATFSVPFHATNYGKNCVLTRISQTYNTQFIDVDIFVGSKTTFRRGLNDTLPGNR
ncbi:hypothetical protein ACJJTC_002757 [Scirpophaga incertulas]